MAEVGGLEADDLGPVEGPSELPRYIGGVDHGTYFEPEDTAGMQWAAVHLRKLFRHGQAKFRNAEDLRKFIGVPVKTKLLLTCIDKDRPIERMWASLLDPGFLNYLKRMKFSSVICPNFSVFHDEPGDQHAYNRKRSLIVAEQLTRFGIPVVPYLHGMGERDWEFWCSFLQKRSNIEYVAKEFQTGLRDPERGKACINGVAQLERALGRALHLVVVGGMQHRSRVARALRRWTLVSFNPFVLAVKRRELVPLRGKLGRSHSPSARPGALFTRSQQQLERDCSQLALIHSRALPGTRAAHSLPPLPLAALERFSNEEVPPPSSLVAANEPMQATN